MTTGWTVVESARTFDAVVASLTSEIESRGLTRFALIDHAAGAAEVGLSMEPEIVIIFGNAAVGTPLMQTAPEIGYELPLRVLVWQSEGRVRLGYRDPRVVAEEHGISPAGAPSGMASMLAGLTASAAGAPAR
jgi:uncharacterized protein (DUF302 family)